MITTKPQHQSLLVACIVILFVAGGCGSALKQQAEAERLQAELVRMQAEAESINKQNSKNSAKLVHVVWLSTREDLGDEGFAQLHKEIQTLAAIEQVTELEVGRFHDLGDIRAMSDFEVVMTMRFASDEDYRAYQEHPVHLALKSSVKQFLDGPPVTYDYWVE